MLDPPPFLGGPWKWTYKNNRKTCNFRRGTLPKFQLESPFFFFFSCRNGEVLRKSENIVSKTGDSALQLHFNNLTLADSGVYTCILENKVGKTRCSAELIVLDDHNSKNMNLRPPVFTMGIPLKSCIVEGKCFQFRIKLQGSYSQRYYKYVRLKRPVFEPDFK